MKKLFYILFALLILSNAFSQSYNFSDEKIKDILVKQNAFGEYLKCNDNNTFVSKFRTRGGDGYHFEGTFKIQNGVITFSNVTGSEWADNLIVTDNNGSLNFNSKYKFLPDKNNGTYIGCLFNLEDKSYFYSVRKIPANMITQINGTNVYKITGELYVTENLKMRDKPSLKSKVVEIKGCDFKCGGWVEDKRKIVFKGMTVTPIAKTVSTETIDGITAPWYYIQQQEHDPLDRNEGDIHYVWIFGGYVKEYPENTIQEDLQELKKSVETTGLKFYQFNNNGETK